MSAHNPAGELDGRFSSGDASPTEWANASQHVADAEVYWLTTVRPDGRPHVTPLIGAWLEGALYFCTGADERKAQNVADNPHVVITTGCNSLAEGLDTVIEGDAVRVTDHARLQGVADSYERKYGADWHFDVGDGSFIGAEGNVALVFEVTPKKAFGFGKGATFSQTRWRF